MDDIYFYKMTNDSGGAPCVDRGTLSLAICKPAIRRKANEGDIIFGFGGKELKEKLIYVARISHLVTDGNYYRDDSGYVDRSDCVYRWRDDELVFRKGARFHNEGCRDHDVGPAGQHDRHANVLIADEFVYFGKAATADYKTSPLLKQAIEAMTQGHRIHHAPELRKELMKLYHHCIEKAGKGKKLGRPHHKPDNYILLF